MKRGQDVVTAIIGFVVIIFVFGVLLALPVYLLWNWLMPDIFGLPKISLFQALGINLLAACLFKSGNQTKQG